MSGWVALHYVRVPSGLYTPGEVFHDALTEEQAEWLISKEAIRPLTEEPTEAREEDEDAEHISIAESLKPVVVEENDDDESEAEAEPPEIDAAAGIVGNEKPAKPAAKRGGRKAK